MRPNGTAPERPTRCGTRETTTAHRNLHRVTAHPVTPHISEQVEICAGGRRRALRRLRRVLRDASAPPDAFPAEPAGKQPTAPRRPTAAGNGKAGPSRGRPALKGIKLARPTAPRGAVNPPERVHHRLRKPAHPGPRNGLDGGCRQTEGNRRQTPPGRPPKTEQDHSDNDP